MFKLPTPVKLVIILLVCLSALFVGCQQAESPKPAPTPVPTPAPTPADAKYVCLIFDDAYWNQYAIVLPILLKYDFKATFSVITGVIGTGQGLWKYMGEKELTELNSYGMDIAGHTKTHPNLTKNLTDQQLREEIIDSKTRLETMGMKVRTFIYPYYEWNDAVINYVMEAGYTCARSGWPEEKAYDLTTTDPKARYHVPGYQIWRQDFAKFKTIVNQASSSSMVCLVYHFVIDTSNAGDDTGLEMTTTPINNFYEQMSYLKEAGFTIVLLPDIVK